MRHDKLVRDRIPELIAAKGEKAVHHVADDAEYLRALGEKLVEEMNELRADPCAGEVADVLEVVEAFAKAHGIAMEDALRTKEEKRRARGGFDAKIILEES